MGPMLVPWTLLSGMLPPKDHMKAHISLEVFNHAPSAHLATMMTEYGNFCFLVYYSVFYKIYTQFRGFGFAMVIFSFNDWFMRVYFPILLRATGTRASNDSPGANEVTATVLGNHKTQNCTKHILPLFIRTYFWPCTANLVQPLILSKYIYHLHFA